jgi:hypothetical protein
MTLKTQANQEQFIIAQSSALDAGLFDGFDLSGKPKFVHPTGEHPKEVFLFCSENIAHYIAQIRKFSPAAEKRVIIFGS